MTKWWARRLTFHCLNDHNPNYSKFKSLNLFSFPWVVYYRDNQLQTWRFSGLPLQGLEVSMLGREEMVLGEGCLGWGLKIWMPFSNCAYKGLTWKKFLPMKHWNGDHWRRQMKQQSQESPCRGWTSWLVTIGVLSLCIFSQLTWFPGQPPNGSYIFLGGTQIKGKRKVLGPFWNSDDGYALPLENAHAHIQTTFLPKSEDLVTYFLSLTTLPRKRD